MPQSQNYELRVLSERVTAAISRDDGVGLSNAGVVAVGDDTLVFDTSISPTAANDLWSAASKVTGHAPTVAANSHWHMDHVLGNQVFAGVPIWATRRTIEILSERREELEGELTEARLKEDVAQLEEQVARARSASEKSYLSLVLRINRAVLSDAPNLRLTAPSRGFERRKRFGKGREVELLSFGAGHTEADAILFLPTERIVFAGDLVVVEQHPNFSSGDPEHWLKVLDAIDRLRPEQIVPGHGPVATGEATGPMRDYISALLTLAESDGPGVLPQRFAKWGEHGQFEENLSFLRSRTGRKGSGPKRSHA